MFFSIFPPLDGTLLNTYGGYLEGLHHRSSGKPLCIVRWSGHVVYYTISLNTDSQNCKIFFSLLYGLYTLWH